MSKPRRGSLLTLVIVMCVTLGSTGLMVYIFAFSAKETDAYQCGVEIARDHDAVKAALGTPIEEGTFAWTSYYESAGSRSEGSLSTTLKGPKGEGDLSIDFFRTPAMSSFALGFDAGDGSVMLHKGSWPCR